MALAIGCSQPAISMWVKSGHIPYRRIPSVVEAARKLNPPIELTAADFIAIPPAEAESTHAGGVRIWEV